MVDIHELYPILEDLLYSKHIHIDIALPYYNMKKDVGLKLIELFKIAGMPYKSITPVEWRVLTCNGEKVINFVTHASVRYKKGRANIFIIQDDK